jgi:hypothetical protein
MDHVPQRVQGPGGPDAAVGLETAVSDIGRDADEGELPDAQATVQIRGTGAGDEHRHEPLPRGFLFPLTLVGKSADRVAIAVRWRQGDTMHGIRGLDEHRRGMSSKRRMSRLGTEGSVPFRRACEVFIHLQSRMPMRELSNGASPAWSVASTPSGRKSSFSTSQPWPTAAFSIKPAA